jgi:hypothetical protein
MSPPSKIGPPGSCVVAGTDVNEVALQTAPARVVSHQGGTRNPAQFPKSARRRSNARLVRPRLDRRNVMSPSSISPDAPSFWCYGLLPSNPTPRRDEVVAFQKVQPAALSNP